MDHRFLSLVKVASQALQCSRCYIVEDENRCIGWESIFLAKKSHCLTKEYPPYSKITPFAFRCSRCDAEKKENQCTSFPDSSPSDPSHLSPTEEDHPRSTRKLVFTKKTNGSLCVAYKKADIGPSMSSNPRLVLNEKDVGKDARKNISTTTGGNLRDENKSFANTSDEMKLHLSSSQDPDGSEKRRTFSELTVEENASLNKRKTEKKVGAQMEIPMMKNQEANGRDNNYPKRKRSKLRNGSRCTRFNGKGWRCKKIPRKGYALCQHHLELARSSVQSKKNRGSVSVPN